jgi:hypothetical protein
MQLRTEAFVKWQSKQPVAKRAGLISALDHIKRSVVRLRRAIAYLWDIY